MISQSIPSIGGCHSHWLLILVCPCWITLSFFFICRQRRRKKNYYYNRSRTDECLSPRFLFSWFRTLHSHCGTFEGRPKRSHTSHPWDTFGVRVPIAVGWQHTSTIFSAQLNMPAIVNNRLVSTRSWLWSEGKQDQVKCFYPHLIYIYWYFSFLFFWTLYDYESHFSLRVGQSSSQKNFQCH